MAERRRIAILAMQSLMLFVWLLFIPSGNLPAETIRVGILTSSPQAYLASAKPYLRGAEMAAAEINAREGTQGTQFLLFLRDFHQQGQEKNLASLRALILEGRLHFLLGAVENQSIDPVARMAHEFKLPFLAFPLDFMEAASTGVESPNLFWISPAPEAFQRAAVRTAAQFLKKRFFLLAQDSSAGQHWAKYFWEELKRLKPDAQGAGEIFLPKKVEDYGPYIQNVLATKAEVCVSQLGAKEWSRFAKIARKQGYFKKIIHFELESGNLETLVSMRKDVPEGIWGISAFPFWALGWKETKDFVTKFRILTNSYPGLEALSGYVSIYAIAEVLKKERSLAPEKMIGSLEGLTFQTPVGPLAIRKSDHRALWPIWCGSSKFISGYPFAILGDLIAFGPDSFFP